MKFKVKWVAIPIEVDEALVRCPVPYSREVAILLELDEALARGIPAGNERVHGAAILLKLDDALAPI